MTDHITSITYYELRRLIEAYCKRADTDPRDFCEAYLGQRMFYGQLRQRPERHVKQSTWDKVERTLHARH